MNLPKPMLTRHFQLSKYPALNNLEKSAGVPKTYAVVGLAALYFFLIIFNLGGQLLTNFAGFVLPGYYSLNALFTDNKDDDTQWLTVSLPTFGIVRTRQLLTYPFSRSIGLCSPSSLLWRASSTLFTGSLFTLSSSLSSFSGSRCPPSGKSDMSGNATYSFLLTRL